VRGVERQVQVEGLGWILGVDQLHGVIADQGGGVARFVYDFVIAIPVDSLVFFVREVVDFTNERTVLIIEATLTRPVLGIAMAKVPLADDGGVIPGVFQRLRQQPFIGRKAIGITRRNDRGLEAVAERVASCHQGCARRSAHGLGIELFEADSARSKLVDVWGLDVGAVIPDVLPALVIRNDVNNVGLLVGRLSGAGKACGKYEKRKSKHLQAQSLQDEMLLRCKLM